jgi:hypothetical protein
MWIFNSILTWLGISIEYIIAFAMIAGGAYLAALFDLAATNPLYWLLRPIRWVGIGLVVAGIIFGSVTYGKTVGMLQGGAAVRQEWEQKNYEAQIAKLKQEAEIRQAAAENAEKAMNEIMNQADALQKQVNDYGEDIKSLPKILANCRLSTIDDDRRLCKLTGDTAVGCKTAPTKRTTRKARPAPKHKP